jgi:hypothetical protein
MVDMLALMLLTCFSKQIFSVFRLVFLEQYFLFLLPSSDPFIVMFVIITFFIAGIVKGFLGLGLPAAVMALLTLVMEPAEAISIIFLPLLFTNLAQFSRSSNRMSNLIKFRYFALALMASILITSTFITAYPKSLLTISIGIAMIIFSIQSLFGFKIPVKDNPLWHIAFGIFSGLLGGISAIWSPPIAMYLMARNYQKDEFIGISGFLFLSGCLPLGLGLYFAGVLTWDTALASCCGLVFVLVGFRVGELMRTRVPQEKFKKILLTAFFVMGLRLILITLNS